MAQLWPASWKPIMITKFKSALLSWFLSETMLLGNTSTTVEESTEAHDKQDQSHNFAAGRALIITR